MEETVKSKTLYRGKILNLRIDEVVLPGGGEFRREIVEHRGAVTILPLLENEILFVRQFRQAVQGEVLELPAGIREDGEDLMTAARRELLEETGYRAFKLSRISSFYASPGYSTEEIHLFLASKLERGEYLPCDEDEDLELVCIKKEKALAMLLQGDFIDAKTTAGLALYFLKERRE